MADIPVGPGQQESIGMGKTKQAPNPPGLYFDPQSRTYHHHAHYAGADAFVRMGFRLVELGQELTATMQAKLAKNATAVPAPPPPTADEVPGDEMPDEDEPKPGKK